MKKLIAVFVIFLVAVSWLWFGQSFTKPEGTNYAHSTYAGDTIPYNNFLNGYGYRTSRLWATDGLIWPVGDTTFGTDQPRAGSVRLKDTVPYIYTTAGKWSTMGGGSSDLSAYLKKSDSTIYTTPTYVSNKINSSLSGYVTLATSQTITAQKIFNGTLFLNGALHLNGNSTFSNSNLFMTALNSGTTSDNVLLNDPSTGQVKKIPYSSLIPSLQSVTNVDSVTTNSIKIVNGSDSVVLHNNGNIVISGSITAAGGGFDSDKRLKKDITTNVPNILDQLRTVGFKWKDPRKGTNEHYGYIAQDVQKFLPGAVMTGGNGMLALDYNAIHTLAIHQLYDIVKKQQAQIDALQQKLNDRDGGHHKQNKWPWLKIGFFFGAVAVLVIVIGYFKNL